MSSISFGNLSTSNRSIPPEMEKRIQSQENFTAIDKEKLKQDTVELTNKAQESVKENFIFRTMRNIFGIKEPKKFLISLGLTAVTALGFARLGNKYNKQIIEFSQKVDDYVQKAPVFKKIGDFTDGIKETIRYITENNLI